jgi:hypothetical protein
MKRDWSCPEQSPNHTKIVKTYTLGCIKIFAVYLLDQTTHQLKIMTKVLHLKINIKQHHQSSIQITLKKY